MTSLVSALIVVGNIFVKVFECSPAVERVPEIVELLHLLFRGFVVAQFWHRLFIREASFGLEDLGPQFVVVACLAGLLAWGLNLSSFVDGVELAALDGVEKNFGSFLDALEERIVLIASRGSLFVGMMTEDLLAVGALDLFLGRSVSVLRQTKNSVVILLLLNTESVCC